MENTSESLNPGLNNRRRFLVFLGNLLPDTIPVAFLAGAIPPYLIGDSVGYEGGFNEAIQRESSQFSKEVIELLNKLSRVNNLLGYHKIPLDQNLLREYVGIAFDGRNDRINTYTQLVSSIRDSKASRGEGLSFADLQIAYALTPRLNANTTYQNGPIYQRISNSSRLYRLSNSRKHRIGTKAKSHVWT